MTDYAEPDTIVAEYCGLQDSLEDSDCTSMDEEKYYGENESSDDEALHLKPNLPHKANPNRPPPRSSGIRYFVAKRSHIVPQDAARQKPTDVASGDVKYVTDMMCVLRQIKVMFEREYREAAQVSDLSVTKLVDARTRELLSEAINSMNGSHRDDLQDDIEIIQGMLEYDHTDYKYNRQRTEQRWMQVRKLILTRLQANFAKIVADEDADSPPSEEDLDSEDEDDR